MLHFDQKYLNQDTYICISLVIFMLNIVNLILAIGYQRIGGRSFYHQSLWNTFSSKIKFYYVDVNLTTLVRKRGGKHLKY